MNDRPALGPGFVARQGTRITQTSTPQELTPHPVPIYTLPSTRANTDLITHFVHKTPLTQLFNTPPYHQHVKNITKSHTDKPPKKYLISTHTPHHTTNSTQPILIHTNTT
uniref:Uncharacterized protein n=1 Tax=Magnetospirillum gryphiswaldense TaxID=55518 RepID=A4U3Y9_9PROT|nr:hypothetical protein MGR_1212 [Magnetospirillum gryphiswaldense MSR-1]